MIDDSTSKKSDIFVDMTRPDRVTGFLFGPQPPDSQEAAPVANQPPSGQPGEQPLTATPIGTKADLSQPIASGLDCAR